MSTLIGIITDIFPAEVRGNFEKRVFRLKQSDVERYPNHWELECHQGDSNLLDGFKVGDDVTCEIIIQGRAWTKDGRTMIFNTLKCIGIAYFGKAAKPVPSTRQQTGGQEKTPRPARREQDGYKPAIGPNDEIPF